MSDKKIVVSLDKAMTWGGVNFAPGLNEMPEAAANSAIKRKLGTIAGDNEKSAESGEENAEFKPLSLSDTMKRFEKMDFADDVMRSMQFHQEAIKEMRASGMSAEEFEKKLEEDKRAFELLPENFPMRHIFAKLGEDYNSVEKIQAISEKDLVEIDGIAEASAKKVLAYKRK